MTLDMGNTDKLAIYKQELARNRIDLLPPDVNRSGVDFTVASIADETADAESPIGGIHYALAAIKGVGRAAMADLVGERDANGPFKSPYEVASRLDAHVLNRRQLEQLVQAGAFDSLDANRARTFDAIDQILGHAQSIQRERESGQFSLLGDAESGAMPELKPADRADWSQADRLQRELDAVGFYMSAHPLDEYGSLLDRLGVVGSAELEQTVERQGGAANVVLAGSVIALQQRTSQRGSKYAFVQLSDAAGTFEVTMFAEVLAASRDILESGKPVLVQTAARIEDGQLRLTGQSVRELEAAAASAPVAIKIWVDGAEPIGSLKTLIDREARPGEGKRANGRIRLIIPDGEQDVIVRLDGGYLCTPELNRAMRAIPGVVDVQEI